MAYWCDDQGLNLEQRRLDAQQAEALEKMNAASSKRLRDVLPAEFAREFNNTRTATMLDVKVIEEYSLTNDDRPYLRWPGREKNVMTWWRLVDGRAVGWNENPARGWSFPVHGRKGA